MRAGGTEGWTLGGAPSHVIVVDPVYDIALVSGPKARALPVADRPPPLGAEVITFGYAFSKPDLLWFRSTLVSHDSQFFNDGAELVVTGVIGLPGMSGGAILWHGKVVSQVSGGSAYMGSGVPYVALKAFVEEHVRPKPYQFWQ